METQPETPTSYQPPQITNVGEFGDLTRGTVFAGTSDDAADASKFYAG